MACVIPKYQTMATARESYLNRLLTSIYHIQTHPDMSLWSHTTRIPRVRWATVPAYWRRSWTECRGRTPADHWQRCSPEDSSWASEALCSDRKEWERACCWETRKSRWIPGTPRPPSVPSGSDCVLSDSHPNARWSRHLLQRTTRNPDSCWTQSLHY